MKRRTLVVLLVLLLRLVPPPAAISQQEENLPIQQMVMFENSSLNLYLEYQKLYYENKSLTHELSAFENLLDVYIAQVMKTYNTLTLTEKETQEPLDIASRALIFRALLFLEKAPLNTENFEKACYAYYESLDLYNNTDYIPALYKDLPRSIKAGGNIYFRMIDIFERKGRRLRNFGKVSLTFRNFSVTADFAPDQIKLIKLADDSNGSNAYTFALAEERIKEAIAKVFSGSDIIDVFVALPYGTYVLTLDKDDIYDFSVLTRFHVRPNQEKQYIMEPLAGRIIMYEIPTSKRPDYYRYGRQRASDQNNEFNRLQLTGTNSKNKFNKQSLRQEMSAKHEMLVEEIVHDLLPNYDAVGFFDGTAAAGVEAASHVIATSVVSFIESSEYYQKLNPWTASWQVAQHVRNQVNPGKMVPTDLVKLIYHVLKEL